MFNLFGFLKRKRCDRRKKSCRKPRRFNVAGSPCNRLKRKTCKANSGCNYVKKRGCRRAKNWRNLIATPDVQSQIAQTVDVVVHNAVAAGAPIAQQALLAGAAAADVAVNNVLANGGTSVAAQTEAVAVAQEVAATVIQNAGGSAADVAQVTQQVAKAIHAAPPPPPPPPPPPRKVHALKIAAKKAGNTNAATMSGLASAAASKAGKLRPTPPRVQADFHSSNPFAEAAAAKAKAKRVVFTDDMKADAAILGRQAADDAADASGRAGNSSKDMIIKAQLAGELAIINYGTQHQISSAQVADFLGEWIQDFQQQATSFGRRVRFGQRFGRRSRFGSMCSALMPKDTSTCVNYNVGGMYPCAWHGGKLNRCQMRPGGPIGYSSGGMGKYQAFIIASVPGLASVTPAPIPPAVSLADIDEDEIVVRGIYDCVGKTQADCGFNPNCNWQPKANSGRGRCIRQAGHAGGEQYQGPMMAFGKRLRRYNVSSSSCNRLKKKTCRSNPNCNYTKRGCRRRKRTKSGAIYQGPSLAFGKRRRKTVHRKAVRKPPAALLKRCRKYHIKTTKKVGKHRVYKSVTVLKKLLKKKIKKMKKMKKKVYSRRH
jgi:hypothetical protein